MRRLDEKFPFSKVTTGMFAFHILRSSCIHVCTTGVHFGVIHVFTFNNLEPSQHQSN